MLSDEVVVPAELLKPVEKTGCMCLWKKEWEYGKILLLKVLEIRIKIFLFRKRKQRIL
jgi:hypothetical protein